MIFMWVAVEKWLIHHGIYNRSVKLIKSMGILAGVFLIVYLVALGVRGDQYQLLRRTGVIVSFSLTFFSELLLYRVMVQNNRILKLNQPLLTVKQTICWILIVVGIGHNVLDMIYSDYDRWQNATEWWFALFLYGYFFTIAAAFKQTGFSIKPSKTME